MSEKKLTGVIVMPDKGKAEKATITDSLDSFYNVLDCTTIDIVERRIGGKYYDIICDDEAPLKELPLVSGVDGLIRPMLFGRLFICHHDDEGGLTSLSEEEVKAVLSNCHHGFVFSMGY